METKYEKNNGFGYLLRVVSCIFAITLLTGCAFSRTPVKVNFSPLVENQLKTAHTNWLEIRMIKDSRPVTDEFVLIQKANQYGPTSGAYITEVPVTKIFQTGLQSALAQNGFTGSNQAQYKLDVDLRGFGFGVIQNGLFNATGKPWMEIRFELVDSTTGQPVW